MFYDYQQILCTLSQFGVSLFAIKHFLSLIVASFMQFLMWLLQAVYGLIVKNFGPEWELGGKSFMYICITVE